MVFDGLYAYKEVGWPDIIVVGYVILGILSQGSSLLLWTGGIQV